MLLYTIETWSFLLLAGLIVVGLVIIFAVIPQILKKILRPVKKEKVQIAEIDRSNGEAERNMRMVPGQNSMSLGSSMGRSVIDNTYIRLYRLEKNNKELRLKLPSQNAKLLHEGDIGYVSYQGEDLVGFERTGNIRDEDQKTIHFNL